MPEFIVEVLGESRELYTVEAETAEEAKANWSLGDRFLQETSGCWVYDAWEDDK